MQTFVIKDDFVRQRAVRAVQNAPEEMEVVIRPHKSKRTLSQNALHWKRLDIIRLHIADSTGQIFTREELHEFFKKRLLPVRLVEIGGEEEAVTATTTKLNTKEMADFMDDIDRYCIDRLNLYLPVPGVAEEAI